MRPRRSGFIVFGSSEERCARRSVVDLDPGAADGGEAPCGVECRGARRGAVGSAAAGHRERGRHTGIDMKNRLPDLLAEAPNRSSPSEMQSSNGVWSSSWRGLPCRVSDADESVGGPGADPEPETKAGDPGHRLLAGWIEAGGQRLERIRRGRSGVLARRQAADGRGWIGRSLLGDVPTDGSFDSTLPKHWTALALHWRGRCRPSVFHLA